MSNIKKLADSSFDTSKTVVICGKGESLTKIHDADLTDKYIACLNSATLFVDRADFLFVTDIERLDSLLKVETDFSKIKNLISPIQVHKNEKPSAVTYLDVAKKTKQYDLDIYTYCLQTQTMPDPPLDNIDKFKFGPEVMYSSFICSLFWLTHAGFRNFEMYGVGTNPKYAQKFIDNNDTGSLRKDKDLNPTPKEWFVVNCMTGISIMQRLGCSFKFN